MNRQIPEPGNRPDAPQTHVRLFAVLLAIRTYLLEKQKTDRNVSVPAILRGKSINIRLNSASQIAFTYADAPHNVRILEPSETNEVMIGIDDAQKAVDFLEESRGEKPAAMNTELAGLIRNWNTMIAGLGIPTPETTDDSVERKNVETVELLKKIVDLIANTVKDIVLVPVGSRPRIIIRGSTSGTKGKIFPATSMELCITQLSGLLCAQTRFVSTPGGSESVELTRITDGQKLVGMFLEILYRINFFGRYADENLFLHSEALKLEERAEPLTPGRGRIKSLPGFISLSRELKGHKEWKLQVGFDCSERP